MNTKKILFISYDGMTDPLGQSQVIPYLSNLTRFGYSFTILSCDKHDKYLAGKDYVEQLIAPFPIQWISIPYHKNPPVISSVYDYFSLRRTARKLHAVNKFDLVHTRPGLPTLVALYLKKKSGIKFINDVRGFWADERVDGGIWNLKNPIFKQVYRFFKKHELECFKKADYVTCLTYAARKEIHQWKNIPLQPIPIEVIPCSVDLDLFNPQKIDTVLKQQLKMELKIDEQDFVVSYLGSLGGWYLTEEMMRFCALMSHTIPKAKFLFITPHSQTMVMTVAEKYGLPMDRVIIKYGKRHEVPVLLSLSSYSIFFIKPCFSKISSSPTKHGEIMAMGIPVITNGGVGDVATIVNKFEAGYVINEFSDETFSAVIGKIMNGNHFNGESIRRGATEFYALESAVNKYLKVYRAILAE